MYLLLLLESNNEKVYKLQVSEKTMTKQITLMKVKAEFLSEDKQKEYEEVCKTYKNERAIIFENDNLKATLLPDWGSKLVSIVYRPQERELLWQNRGKRYKKTAYGDGYDKGELSGFDEMFPTISRCVYESFPWTGTEMPDHGEVWSIPWESEITKNSAHLRVYGIRFPYKLEKRVRLKNTQVCCWTWILP